jgi:hypothetical protein
MKLAHSSLLAFVLVAVPSLAHAQSEPEPPPLPAGEPVTVVSTPASAPAAAESPPGPKEFVAPHYDYLRIGAGFRIGYINDPAFDTFASSDVLAQFSLEATYAFYTKGKLAIAAGGAYDVGSRSSGARGISTSLTVHRLSVPIEARYYFAPWLNAFARVAPGAAAFNARIDDPSSPSRLQDAPWVYSADFSGGASIRLAGKNDHASRTARLWLTSEVGYGITSSHAPGVRPDRNQDDVLGSDEATKLGSLAANGAFWRMGVAVSF